MASTLFMCPECGTVPEHYPSCPFVRVGRWEVSPKGKAKWVESNRRKDEFYPSLIEPIRFPAK
jgi:hypothetical protein